MAIKRDDYESTTPSLDDLVGDGDASLIAALAEAKELKKQGKSLDAVALLRDLANRYPGEKVVFILLGHLYWDDGDLPHARFCFQKATELDPQLEIASLALYHTRWSSGLREEALEEMKRYIQISHSHEYDRILQSFRAAKNDEELLAGMDEKESGDTLKD